MSEISQAARTYPNVWTAPGMYAPTSRARGAERAATASPAVAKRWWQLDFFGVLCGVMFAGAALVPTLLPRSEIFQGVVSGFGLAFGYGFGAAAAWSARKVVRRHHHFSHTAHRTAWQVLFTGVIAAAVMVFPHAVQWENQTRAMVGQSPLASVNMLAFAGVTIGVSSALIWLARGVRGLARSIERKLHHHMSRAISAPTAGVLVIAILGAIAWCSGITGLGIAQGLSNQKNASIPPGISAPVSSATLSGGKGSIEQWSQLGYQGQQFIGTTPSRTRIAATAGIDPRAAADPIRVYIGLDYSENPQVQAQAALDELDRTGAWSRKELLVVSPTGSGGLDSSLVDSFDYSYRGDDAIVSTQYSDLPSWISFLSDKSKATSAAQALFSAVYAKWATLPAATRPKLVVAGFSLGSYAMQSNFTSIAQLRSQTDGALFAGTPNATPLWQSIEQGRDAGSPAWQPVYDAGENVRFFATPSDFARSQAGWQPDSRVVYLQHADDGVTWWNWSLAVDKPDWAQAPRGLDVNPQSRWLPLTGFVAATIDMATSQQVPDGFGHNYGTTTAQAWDAIIPTGNSPAVQQAIAARVS